MTAKRMSTFSTIRAFIGNPLFTQENKAEYDALNVRLQYIPNFQYVYLYYDKVVVHFKEGKKTFKYPTKGVTTDWLYNKIATLGVSTQKKYEWRSVPLSVERFCKQAKELCRKGGTMNYEKGEYVLRWQNYTARWMPRRDVPLTNPVIKCLSVLCAETAELERLRTLAQKHGLA